MPPEIHPNMCQITESLASLHVTKTPPEDIKPIEPVDSFRWLSALPTTVDIHRKETPVLSKNLVNERYNGLDPYLDTQFRLLREDMVRPLVEVIRKYRSKAQDGEGEKIVLFQNLQFKKWISSRDGILLNVSFDKNDYIDIDWDEDERLKQGSLLVLSSDGFETMFFATVARRKPYLLRQGLVCLKLESNFYELFRSLSDNSIVAIQSPTYAEAYRYSLDLLQTIQSESDLPLHRYLVDCDVNVQEVAYLKGDGTFNLEKLALPLDQTTYTFDEIEASYKMRSVDAFQMKDFDGDWPILKVDQSQFRALHESLTQELALIQGPPGTGYSGNV